MPTRSNRVIADLVGCAEGTVRTAREALEDIAQVTQYRGSAGKPRKDGSPAQPLITLHSEVQGFSVQPSALESLAWHRSVHSLSPLLL